ncbi:Esterase FE4 [Orchesella cincta]|uniref:Carboxylic ester hydrolase n=1 Tax=Orchesella cincta TaxID=48709 RepID=A0A1D2NIG1_ORCCI|nr:Esterase FE4 [Orchesella cincta]
MEIFQWFLTFILTFELSWAQLPSSSRITLQTTDGLFIGTKEPVDRDRSRREYYSFTGIPYAKPPILERRWQEPELLEIDGGTHHATSFGPKCPQYDSTTKSVTGSENCLFLNIYTPYIPGGGRGIQSARPLLPVVVFFHGGGFQKGSADTVGPKRFMRHDVILVTVNYRLGVLGYLSTGDDAIAGNFGGLDQIASLKWVQKYIRGFGGNPGRVTIAGHSAGGAAVHMLMLSPRALGLFHGAIIQSGSAFCDWAINEKPFNYAEKIGEIVGCFGGSFELASCLQEKSIEELIEAQQSLISFSSFPVLSSPVIDVDWRGEDAFLHGKPKELMDAGAFAQVPVIAGVTHDEGLSIYARLHLEVGAEQFKDQDYFENQLLPDLITNLLDNAEPLDVTVDAVKAQYFEEMDVENETKRVITELSEMIGDSMIYSCHWDMLERFAVDSRSPVYSYVFSHKTPASPSLSSSEIRRIRQMGIHHPLFNFGVSHGDDLFYLFEPIKGSNERMGQEDERVADIMTRAWVSFATTGSPASGLHLIPNSVPWRPIRPGNINYYNLTSMPSPMGEDFRKGEALFWLRTIPYIQQLGTTITDLQAYPTYFWIAFGVALFLLLVAIILLILLWRRRSY